MMESTLGAAGAIETDLVGCGCVACNNMRDSGKPPKSLVRRSAGFARSCIQSSPRNFWNAWLLCTFRQDFFFYIFDCNPEITRLRVAGKHVAARSNSITLGGPAAHSVFGNFGRSSRGLRIRRGFFAAQAFLRVLEKFH